MNPLSNDALMQPASAPSSTGGLLALHQPGPQSDRLWLASQRLLPQAFRAVQQADAVLQEAQAMARRQLQAHQQELQVQRTQAQQAGFAQGRREGMAAVLGTLALERRMRALFAARMADVVEQCMRQMLGDIGSAELFRQRVLHLLTQADRRAVILHVCPAQAHWAHAAVQPLADASGDLSWLVILSDNRLAPDAMVLETRTGFIDASIELTMAGMRELIAEAVTRASLRTSLAVAEGPDREAEPTSASMRADGLGGMIGPDSSVSQSAGTGIRAAGVDDPGLTRPMPDLGTSVAPSEPAP